MGQLAESMGLQTQVGKIRFRHINKLELPVMIKRNSNFSLIANVTNENIVLADPELGWVKLDVEQAQEEWGEEIEVVLIRRLSDTPRRIFGWSWFTPVVKRFKWPLVQVLLASLFIQLFQLANPLLLQQIIDKVINQSNLSALQVLGGT